MKSLAPSSTVIRPTWASLLSVTSCHQPSSILLFVALTRRDPDPRLRWRYRCPSSSSKAKKSPLRGRQGELADYAALVRCIHHILKAVWLSQLVCVFCDKVLVCKVCSLIYLLNLRSQLYDSVYSTHMVVTFVFCSFTAFRVSLILFSVVFPRLISPHIILPCNVTSVSRH